MVDVSAICESSKLVARDIAKNSLARGCVNDALSRKLRNSGVIWAGSQSTMVNRETHELVSTDHI